MVVDDLSDQCALFHSISIWQINMCSNENMCCLRAQHLKNVGVIAWYVCHHARHDMGNLRGPMYVEDGVYE